MPGSGLDFQPAECLRLTTTVARPVRSDETAPPRCHFSGFASPARGRADAISSLNPSCDTVSSAIAPMALVFTIIGVRSMREPVLIFDFGNVVGFFDYLRACERLAGHGGMSGIDFRDRMVDRGFPRLLAEFESGRIAPQRFAESVMELSGVRLAYEDFVRAWEDIFWPNESVARLIESLKSMGYPLYLGSNTNLLHATFYRRQFATTLDLFDGFILSYEVGHMKPAREFFDACVRAAGVPAPSCVFIDDIPENVEGARQAGLTAMYYVDTPALIEDLRRAGVEVPAGEF